MSWNLANIFIRAGKTPAEKDKRRLMIAGLCFVGALVCARFGGWALIGSAVLVGIGLWKIWNAYRDQT